MNDDKYTMNIEEGADLVIKAEHNYIVCKMIGVPEDAGLPEDQMKLKAAVIYGEYRGQYQKSYSIGLNASECKQLADFLLKVWEESK